MAKDIDDAIDAKVIERAFRRLSPLHQQLFVSIRIVRWSYEEVERLPGFTKGGVMREMARMIYWLSYHVGDVALGRRPNLAERFWRWLWSF